MMHSNRQKAGFIQIGNKKIYVYEGINCIGRNIEAVVILRDVEASQNHAIITIINGGAHYISDLKSTNGTLLNGMTLKPFDIYSIKNDDVLQFTTTFKGTYVTLSTNSALTSNMTQTPSDESQLDSGLFGATTQVNSYTNLLNDGEDENMSNLEINTQIIDAYNNSLPIHDRQAQRISVMRSDIHDVATQITASEMSLNQNSGTNETLGASINEAETQIMSTQRFFFGSNCLSNSPCLQPQQHSTSIYEVATQVQPNVQANTDEGTHEMKQEIISEIPSINDAETQVLESTQMMHTDINPNLGDAAVHSSNETATALRSSMHQGTIISCNLGTSEAELVIPPHTVENVVTEEVNNEERAEETEISVKPQCSTQRLSDTNAEIITQSQSPIPFAKRKSRNPLNSDSDSDGPNINNKRDNDDTLPTQSLTPIRRSKRKTINPLDSDSETELETSAHPAPKATANDSDTDVDEDIALKAKAIADLSTQTVDNSQFSSNSKVSLESVSSLNLHLSTQNEVHSDDSTDFLQIPSPVMSPLSERLASTSTSKETSSLPMNIGDTTQISDDEIVNSGTDVEDAGNAPQGKQQANDSDDTDVDVQEAINNANKKKRFSKRISKRESIIVDSDSDDDKSTKDKSKSTVSTPSANASASNKSKFVITDSDATDKEVEPKDPPAKVIQKPTIFSDTDDDEIEDSFVKRRSIGDVSMDLIPATQDCNASFQPRTSVGSESFKLDLSHIDEISESSIKPKKSTLACVIDSGDDSEPLADCTTLAPPSVAVDVAGDFDFIAPTQPILQTPALNANSLDDSSCDFIAPTQPLLTRKRHSNQSDSEAPSAKLHELDRTGDCDYEAATQKVNDDFDFIAPTQCFVVKANISTEEEFDFIAPTQIIPVSPVRNKNTNGNTQSDFDFDAVTQKMADDTDKAQPDIATPQNLDDSDDFIAATQIITANNGNKDQPKRSDTIDFEAATQPINANVDDDVFCLATQAFTHETATVPLSEAETQKIEVTVTEQPIEKIILKKQAEVESQLEVMFHSQNVSPADTSRPSNPLANVLDAASTQDIVEMLTGAKKRNSDEFENNESNIKRPKLVAQNKTTRSSTARKSSASKTVKKDKLVASTSSAAAEAATSFMANFLQQTNNNNDTKRSKLSLIKKASEPLNESDDSLPSDFVESFGVIVPIQTKEMPKIVEEPLSDVATNANEDSESVKKPSKGRRRQLLDEETMCEISATMLTTPTSEKKKTSARKAKTISENEENVAEPTKITTKARGKPKGNKKKEVTASRTTRSRQTRSSVASSMVTSSESEAEVVATKKVEPKKSVPKRASTRAKKKVQYNDFPIVESIDVSDEEEKIVIRVPKKQVKLMSSDKESDKDVSHIVQECFQQRPKRGRPSQKEKLSEELVSTPERNKRALKPKVIFTMLDDPQLTSVIRSLGGAVVDKLEASTVLVTKKIQRTLKLLSYIGYAKPICSPEWLHECKKANKFVDPWDHLIKDHEAETQWNFNIQESFQRSKQRKLFDGYTFQVLVTVSTDVIKGSIESNGGKVVTRKPSDTDKFIVVAAPSQKNKYSTLLKNKIKVVSAEAILIGILRQELIFDQFLLE